MSPHGKEQIFVSKMNNWLKHKLENICSEFDYSMDAVLYFDNYQGKVCKNVWEIHKQIKVLFEGSAESCQKDTCLYLLLCHQN